MSLVNVENMYFLFKRTAPKIKAKQTQPQTKQNTTIQKDKTKTNTLTQNPFFIDV